MIMLGTVLLQRQGIKLCYLDQIHLSNEISQDDTERVETSRHLLYVKLEWILTNFNPIVKKLKYRPMIYIVI